MQSMVMEEGKSLEDYKGMAKKRGLRTILCLKDTGNTVTAFDMLTGNVDENPCICIRSQGDLIKRSRKHKSILDIKGDKSSMDISH